MQGTVKVKRELARVNSAKYHYSVNHPFDFAGNMPEY